MRTRVFLIGGLLAALLAGCEDVGEYRAEAFVFGTSVGMQIRGSKVDVADAAFADITKRFQFMHEDWHAWEPGILTEINGQLAIGRQAHAPPDILLMIQRSKIYEERSEGMFNPAAGGLIEMWGFHTSEWPVYRHPPGDQEIAEWLLAGPKMSDIEVKGNILSTENRSVQLDFGGLAKGHAVDLAMQVFNNHGIEYAMVNAGGDLRARGTGRHPWKIGIMDGAGGIVGSINVINDESVFTSAIDQRFREDEEGRQPHVLDPRTGRPASGLRSVTVIARSGILADAAATALLVAGPDHWERIAEQMGIDEALVVTDEGQVIVTVPMEGRMHWLGHHANSRQIAER